MCLVWVFLLLWFLFLLFLFIILCFLLPRPRTHLRKKTIHKKNIFHFVCLSGSFAKMSFPKLFVFFGGCFSSTEHVLVGCCWNMFEGSKVFIVASWLWFCRLGVWERAFFRSNLFLCMHSSDSLCSLFVFFFCLFGVFSWVQFFLFFLFSSSSWDCLSFVAPSWCCFFYVVSWLLVSPCGFLGCPFTGTLPGGRLGMANWEGSISFGFSHSRDVWVKTLSPMARVFANLLAWKRCI